MSSKCSLWQPKYASQHRQVQAAKQAGWAGSKEAAPSSSCPHTHLDVVQQHHHDHVHNAG